MLIGIRQYFSIMDLAYIQTGLTPKMRVLTVQVCIVQTLVTGKHLSTEKKQRIFQARLKYHYFLIQIQCCFIKSIITGAITGTIKINSAA
jgi:hypothetical protein